jgi:D-alanyl-lipoteichoic acid acyltransferase DltB (MBOAT superfamily)
MLLIASYLFYGWWDWRFLSLIFLSTVVDYFCGLKIFNEASNQKKKGYLFFSILVNLSLLGFFKYWNFFSETLEALLLQIGFNPSVPALNIILPVGISFYTFQTMTYSIDIYRGRLKPTNNFINFALFVSFFPQLVAGPIERAKSLLPQIENKRHFDKTRFSRGLSLIFWGLFMKIFVADNLGIIVNQIYGNPESTGIEYIIATWAFAFQIFGDFSGYSDIARGTAKCLGIELMHNFKQPYFAKNPSDFWRRWHISLSTWLRDYLYISLGGNKNSTVKTYRNLMLTMLIGGLWHGAAWNFVIWGGYHGGLLCAFRIFKEKTNLFIKSQPSLGVYMIESIVMFQLVCIGWVFFRADSFEQILNILHQVLIFSSIPIADILGLLAKVAFFISIPLTVMFFQILNENKKIWFLDNKFLKYFDLKSHPTYFKSFIYAGITYLLCFYGAKAQSFIYFQF